jgi:hypothetical protein
MLAHELDAVAHQHDGVERGPAALRRSGGVSGDAMEGEAGRSNGKHTAVNHRVAVFRVPVKHYIYVLEQARAEHVDLAGATLLSRRAVEAQSARGMVLHHVILHRDGSERRARAQEIVAAAVARCAVRDGLAVWLIGDAGLNLEACCFEVLLEQRGTLLLVIAEFGVFPDLAGGVFVLGAVGGYVLLDLLMCRGCCLTGRMRNL